MLLELQLTASDSAPAALLSCKQFTRCTSCHTLQLGCASPIQSFLQASSMLQLRLTAAGSMRQLSCQHSAMYLQLMFLATDAPAVLQHAMSCKHSMSCKLSICNS
jgi:hypothetical protein